MSLEHCEDLAIDVSDGTLTRPGFRPERVKCIRITMGSKETAFYVDMSQEIALQFLKTFGEAAKAAWGDKAGVLASLPKGGD